MATARETLAKFVIQEGWKKIIKDERLLAERALRDFEILSVGMKYAWLGKGGEAIVEL